VKQSQARYPFVGERDAARFWCFFMTAASDEESLEYISQRKSLLADDGIDTGCDRG